MDRALYACVAAMGFAYIMAGVIAAPARVIPFVIQYLSPDKELMPQTAEKLALVPVSSILTGSLILAGLATFWGVQRLWGRERGGDRVSFRSYGRARTFILASLTAHFLISSMNLLSGITAFRHQAVSAVVLSGEERGEAGFYRFVREAIRKIPEDANVMLLYDQTQTPDFSYHYNFLNYDLYPRKVYLYPQPYRSLQNLDKRWAQQRGIAWLIAYVNDKRFDPSSSVIVPLRF